MYRTIDNMHHSTRCLEGYAGSANTIELPKDEPKAAAECLPGITITNSLS